MKRHILSIYEGTGLAATFAATLAVALLVWPPAKAADRHTTFITLGTASGPIANPLRFQPANLLRFGDEVILIDAGDGAPEQLAKAGVSLDTVGTVVISHLHIDHTGSLFAILGMRIQTLSPNVLTIYGPPGTKETVDGLIAAAQPFVEAGAAMRGRSAVRIEDTVKVIEVTDGSTFNIGEVRVTAAANTHFSMSTGRDDQLLVSLSYRFDAPDRSIVYTGDTGPSTNVERLAHNADLLVSEISDPDLALAGVKKRRPDLPPGVLSAVEAHFRHEHLDPDQAGLLAEHAGVKNLVLTHNPIGFGELDRVKGLIATHYKGPITFAKDLDQF